MKRETVTSMGFSMILGNLFFNVIISLFESSLISFIIHFILLELFGLIVITFIILVMIALCYYQEEY